MNCCSLSATFGGSLLGSFVGSSQGSSVQTTRRIGAKRHVKAPPGESSQHADLEGRKASCRK